MRHVWNQIRKPWHFSVSQWPFFNFPKTVYIYCHSQPFFFNPSKTAPVILCTRLRIVTCVSQIVSNDLGMEICICYIQKSFAFIDTVHSLHLNFTSNPLYKWAAHNRELYPPVCLSTETLLVPFSSLHHNKQEYHFFQTWNFVLLPSSILVQICLTVIELAHNKIEHNPTQLAAIPYSVI